METLSLVPFAPQSGGPVRALTARVERGPDSLSFEYTLDADLAKLLIPPRRAAAPANELWKHTCFEAFLMPAAGGGEYRELNFSPSTEWAAYSFHRYREGMAPVAMSNAPAVRIDATESQLRVDARVDLRPLLAHPHRIRIALSAVIEDDRGGISYWALKHAPDRPDFHHPAGFILEV